MKKFTLLLILFPTIVYAQNPCAGALSPLSLVAPTSAIVATFTDYKAVFNNQPVWTETEIGIFSRGANPTSSIQITGLTSPKAQWILVTNTNDCYRLPAGTFLFGIQPNVEYDLYIRTKNSMDMSNWSHAVPFGRIGPSLAPTAVRIIP